MGKCKDCKKWWYCSVFYFTSFVTYIVNTLDRITEGLKKTYRRK